MTPNSKPIFSLNDFKQSKYIIAAVSGGSDSLALMFLLHDFLLKHGEECRLIAITVDHGLRAESAIEAQNVHQLCLKHGITHDIMVWQGEKPKTGISDKARTARYNLLCKAAEHYHSTLIVTGHTLDDQIETFRMRQKRVAPGQADLGQVALEAVNRQVINIRGLAGMAKHALLQQKYSLLRPLLNCSRADLRNYLKNKNIAWVDDPSNDNLHYERVRIRKNPINDAVAHIRHQIQCAQQQREEDAHAIAKLILITNAHFDHERLILQNIDDSMRNRPIFAKFIEVLTAIIGGQEFIKPLTMTLTTFLTKAPISPQKATHCATLIENRKNELRLWREQRNFAPTTVKAGKTGVWDGRFIIFNGENADFIVRNPNLDEIHAILHSLKKTFPRTEKHHIPSLLGSLLIERKTGLELPFLAPQTDMDKHYQIMPLLRPFHWLASGHDFAMLSPLYQLMEQRMVINNKIDGFNTKNLAQIISCTLASDN